MQIRYLEPNANKDIVYQNVWAASTMILSEYFMTLYVYIKKEKTGRKIRVQ